MNIRPRGRVSVPLVLIVSLALSLAACGSSSKSGASGSDVTLSLVAYSTPQNQGFNSSALSISDAVGSASSIAVMGLVFTALAGTDAGFPAVFGIAVVLALGALVPGLRLGHAHEAVPSR